MVEMLTGHPPWHELEGVAVIYRIATQHPPVYRLPDSISRTLRAVIASCFALNSDIRPSAETLLKNAMFTEIGRT
jgi:serine/threonine protein kinase